MENNRENLGPAEEIIRTLVNHADHLYHGRPGLVRQDARTVTGVQWEPVTTEVKDGVTQVFKLIKVGRKNTRQYVGDLTDTGLVVARGRAVGRFQPPGLFPEVAKWFYTQVATVWEMDNEFAAKWASYAFSQDHRDLKVVLAAFMLVQARKGDPVRENEEVLFFDDDFRDVGEAMVLITAKSLHLNPKQLIRIHDLLSLDGIAEINRNLGFGKSARNPFYGRWPKVVRKWLNFREENPWMLEGLVKAGFRTTVMELARRVGYKPITPKFFETLRWKQKQAPDGRREILIGAEVSAAENWAGLTEVEICEKIEAERPNWKRIVSLLPTDVGVTRAVMAAAIDAGSLSDKDIILATPTLDELGLLKVPDIRERWDEARQKAEDMRAAHIARNVRSKDVQDALKETADQALQKAVKEATKDLTVYVFVDVSASMSRAIETAKEYVAKFLAAFPPEQLHVCVFNTRGREVSIKHRSAAGVAQAFKGISAGGGTDYGAGVRCLQNKVPKENSDVIFIFIGDEGATDFHGAVRQSGLNPLAFGLLRVGHSMRRAVENTANRLEIPCFKISEDTFTDPYAIPRTIRNLVEATPVGTTSKRRVNLVDKILETDLLEKPLWAGA